MTKQEQLEQVKLMQTELHELRLKVQEYEGTPYGLRLKDMFGKMFDAYIHFMNSIQSESVLTKEVK